MMNSEFRNFATNDYDYYPTELRDEIDSINQLIYERVNNGVYRAGFATRQQPYERAARRLFETLGPTRHDVSNRSVICWPAHDRS